MKGGAYGSLYLHQRKGQTAFASYRDPNIRETLAVYRDLPEYLENIDLTEEELTKYIIGSISPLEQPKSARSKGVTALSRLKNDLSAQEIKELKEEILATEVKDLTKLASNFEDLLKQDAVVVIGNKVQIEKEKELFDEIHTLY